MIDVARIEKRDNIRYVIRFDQMLIAHAVEISKRSKLSLVLFLKMSGSQYFSSTVHETHLSKKKTKQSENVANVFNRTTIFFDNLSR